MLARRFLRSRIFSSGLLVAACSLAVGNAAAQEGSVTTVSVQKPALIEAVYLDLPSTLLIQENSPSDSVQAAKQATDDKASIGSSAADKAAGRDALAPMQNRELSIKVQPASIAPDKIGTGLIPTPSSSRISTQPQTDVTTLRGMYHTHVYWRASNIQHNPLYFEDAMLERHGHTRSFYGYDYAQSVISGVKFFATLPLLPYHETLRPKCQCVYALGHYRAGSTAPCLRDNIPYDSRAAIVESASAAAFFWAAPL
ncbi:MAG: hypothetical protein U0930_22395 [Pirellulales bacterium]